MRAISTKKEIANQTSLKQPLPLKTVVALVQVLILINILNLLAIDAHIKLEVMTRAQNILSRELIKAFALKVVGRIGTRVTADERTETKRKKKKPKNERNTSETKTESEPTIFEI